MDTAKKVSYTVSIVFAIGWICFEAFSIRNSMCASSFGPELNQKRKSLHIPIIPASWQVYGEKEETCTHWVPKDKVVRGHGYKTVVYHSCELDDEEDHYYLDSKNPHDTILEVDYKYINSKRRKDSTIFIFQIGNYADTISKIKADSILKANKTNLD